MPPEGDPGPISLLVGVDPPVDPMSSGYFSFINVPKLPDFDRTPGDRRHGLKLCLFNRERVIRTRY